MISLSEEPNLIIGSHGENDYYDPFSNSTEVDVNGNGATFETQAVIIPVNLNGLMNGDTDSIISIKITWYDGVDLLLQSLFWFEADKANSRYRVKIMAYEHGGATSSGTAYIEIDEDIRTIFLQSKITGETDGVIGVETMVSHSLTTLYSNGLSKGFDFDTTVDNVIVTVYDYIINDFEACIMMAPPFLTIQRTGNVAVCAPSFPVPPDRSATYGTTLTFDSGELGNFMVEVKEDNLMPVDWYNGIINEQLDAVYHYIPTTLSQDVLDIVNALDDTQENSSGWRINAIKDFFGSMGANELKDIFTRGWLKGLIGDIFNNIVTDSPGDKDYLGNFLTWIVDVFIWPWIEEAGIEPSFDFDEA